MEKLRSTKELSCLYFPYADPKPSPSLLMASLLFDKIYFLERNFFKRPTHLNQHEIEPAVDHSLSKIGVFREIGASVMGFNVEFKPDRPLSEISTLMEIQSSIVADMSNPELKKLVTGQGKLHWYLPNGQYLFWNGLGILFDLSRKSLEEIPEIITDRTKFYKEFTNELGLNASVKRLADARLRDMPGELMVRLPFLRAEALMVAVSLHACREFNLTPFTDDPLHHQYLVAKLKQLSGRGLVAANATGVSMTKGIDYAQLGIVSLSLAIPAISNITPEKVILLRHKCISELQRFRAELCKLSFKIENDPWDSNYLKVIDRLVRTDINPAVTDLRDKLRSLKSELGLTIIDKGINIAPIPLILNMSLGLPMELVLPASVGAVWLKEILAYYKKRSDIKKNGVSFLLNFR